MKAILSLLLLFSSPSLLANQNNFLEDQFQFEITYSKELCLAKSDALVKAYIGGGSAQTDSKLTLNRDDIIMAITCTENDENQSNSIMVEVAYNENSKDEVEYFIKNFFDTFL